MRIIELIQISAALAADAAQIVVHLEPRIIIPTKLIAVNSERFGLLNHLLLLAWLLR